MFYIQNSEHLQTLQNIQNNSYAIYTYYKIKSVFLLFSEHFLFTGTHEPDLVRFKFRRTRTGFGSVSAPMNQIIINTVPQSTPFALPSHIMLI